MTQIQRKPWKPEETERLIKTWDEIGSIVVISILLGRSQSSVQTQASRIALPRRSEQLQRHRRRWSRSEERQLEASLKANTTGRGMIDIYSIAEDLNRSVDAIAAKLQDSFASEAELAEKIDIPDHIQEIMDRALDKDKKAQPYTERGTIKDTRYKERMRNCLTCENPFWSEGAHNRICDRCKKQHDSDD